MAASGNESCRRVLARDSHAPPATCQGPIVLFPAPPFPCRTPGDEGKASPSASSPPAPEPCFPAAAVLEPDVEVFGIEPKEVDQREHPAGEGVILRLGGGLRPGPSFADPVAETEATPIAHPQN